MSRGVRRSARDARFGANWQTSAFNPVNVNAALGSFVSSNPNAASLVQSFLRVQATLWLLRSIYDAVVIDGVVAARRRVRDAADVDADAADVDADAAVHHLLPDAVVAVTGTVTGTVDVRRRRRPGFVSRLVRFVHLPRRDERRPDVLLRRHVRRVRRLLRRRRCVLSIAG